jgi:hypothetical protein
MTTMLKLVDLRWRKRRTPGDTLVGKVGEYWLMVVPRSSRKLGPDDVAELDPVYATLFVSTGPEPFEGPKLSPEEIPNG